MPRTPPETMGELERLARERFADPSLTDAELRLLRSASIGEIAFCGPNRDPNDLSNDPNKAGEWGREREIRASLIRWLYVDRGAKELVDPKGVQVFGAKIPDLLELSFVSAGFPLRLGQCRLVRALILAEAEIGLLDLQGTWVHSIYADGVSVKGSLFLRNRFRSDGEVRLLGARVGGVLDCSNGTFHSPSHAGAGDVARALTLDGVAVRGSIFLRNLRSRGEVRILSADIGLGLECQGAHFDNSPRPGYVVRPALDAQRISVGHSVFLNQGFRADGGVRMLGAQIGRDLDCHQGFFRGPAEMEFNVIHEALSLDGARVNGSVFLNGSFQAEGEVRLLGAQIEGDLACDAGIFRSSSQVTALRGGKALSVDGASIKGNVFLRDGSSVEGEVRLVGAQIGGNLECDGSNFSNPAQKGLAGTGTALSADGILVKGSVFLRNKFRARGEMRLPGAQIGGDLDCSAATIHNPAQKDVGGTGCALLAAKAIVKGGVLFCNGFNAGGDVHLDGAGIVGNLTCRDAEFHGQLTLEDASIGGAFRWSNIADAEHVRLDLIDAGVDGLVDDKESWPRAGNLLLDGFVYRRISGSAPRSAESRLDWLSRQGAFTPQLYRQLAKVLKEEGDDQGARSVLFEMERLRRVQGSPKWYQRFWGLTLRKVVGYGYYPARALKWLVGVVVVGFIVFWIGYARQGMAPTDADAYKEYREAGHTPAHYERFHALIYSLENTAPLVKFGQVDRWQPDPNPQHCVKCLLASSNSFSICVSMAGFLRWVRWIQTAFGWVLATFFVAAVTGIVRKD